MVTAEGLEKMDWVLYPPGFPHLNGIDGASHRRCVQHGLRTGIMNHRDDIKVMEIKSAKWGSINGFHHMKIGHGLVMLPEIKRPEQWLNTYFPGWETLNELRDE
jgi:hypothetical protein